MVKPEPLNLEDIRKEVIELMIKKQPYSLQLLEANFPSRYWEIIGEIILYTHKILKQRIKKACNFYDRYRDKPELLIKEHPEYLSDVVKICGYTPINVYPTKYKIKPNKGYDEWLFKLTFNFQRGD